MTPTEIFAFYALPGLLAAAGFGLGVWFRVRASRRKRNNTAQASFNFGGPYYKPHL